MYVGFFLSEIDSIKAENVVMSLHYILIVPHFDVISDIQASQ
ncbi:hypothetical protein AF72_01305 [Xylella taiwanensis]|uniref:Uncharacterized protein n=1 Tax=Xylella taiwanensis TaxID=1444770 RepID=Z9JN62_9GAMM|nr:hypothetical protein AF72_01305 [Xylella taiwanensis]